MDYKYKSKFKCPVCGFKTEVKHNTEEAAGELICEGDNWPHVDRGHHEQTVMEETRLSRLL
jgi:transcription elongation factor Elf1